MHLQTKYAVKIQVLCEAKVGSAEKHIKTYMSEIYT